MKPLGLAGEDAWETSDSRRNNSLANSLHKVLRKPENVHGQLLVIILFIVLMSLLPIHCDSSV